MLLPTTIIARPLRQARPHRHVTAATVDLRHRLREIGADQHRVKSAPHLSSVAKAAAKIQIEMLAEAGAPDVDRAIEHGLPIDFQTTVSTALVHGTDKPAWGIGCVGSRWGHWF